MNNKDLGKLLQELENQIKSSLWLMDNEIIDCYRGITAVDDYGAVCHAEFLLGVVQMEGCEKKFKIDRALVANLKLIVVMRNNIQQIITALGV